MFGVMMVDGSIVQHVCCAAAVSRCTFVPGASRHAVVPALLLAVLSWCLDHAAPAAPAAAECCVLDSPLGPGRARSGPAARVPAATLVHRQRRHGRMGRRGAVSSSSKQRAAAVCCVLPRLIWPCHAACPSSSTALKLSVLTTANDHPPIQTPACVLMLLRPHNTGINLAWCSRLQDRCLPTAAPSGSSCGPGGR